MSAPTTILKLQDELTELINKDDKPYLLVPEVAKYLGIDHNVLRHMIYAGNCPFAIGKSKEGYGNGFVKIPKLPFYNWVTKGVIHGAVFDCENQAG